MSEDSYAQSLLDQFSTPDKLPQIAVSVDMLDTGVDIPEIVNLVFFKIVRSKTKFFQMIGLDKQAAKRAFSEYLDRQTLTVNQIRFIDLIIDYLSSNGVIEAELLYEPPFTDYSPSGLDGVFSDADANGIVAILSSIRNAAVA